MCLAPTRWPADGQASRSSALLAEHSFFIAPPLSFIPPLGFFRRLPWIQPLPLSQGCFLLVVA